MVQRTAVKSVFRWTPPSVTVKMVALTPSFGKTPSRVVPRQRTPSTPPASPRWWYLFSRSWVRIMRVIP